ncbi:uncharacterized protein [Leptinotarsa decemlineata]|uniref:uncharacterized protein n=1 Tax=Leptinotarsa decemlineata TaxID=7539 RepID=UPI000C254F54|nr:uncharacterized protein LOC111513487 [Leptinotarsa decemlineata]
MAEQAIGRRKSHLFLNNISAVTNTYDELVRDKLEGGKFPTTITGIIQLIGVLVLLFSVSLFLGQHICPKTPSWYAYLFPVVVLSTLSVQIVLYLIFSIGCTVSRPGFWIYLDIGVMLFLSLVTIICSVITYKECNQTSIEYQIPGPCAMAGGVILVVSCGSIFLLYRYVEEEMDVTPIDGGNSERPEGRKSIFA